MWCLYCIIQVTFYSILRRNIDVWRIKIYTDEKTIGEVAGVDDPSKTAPGAGRPLCPLPMKNFVSEVKVRGQIVRHFRLISYWFISFHMSWVVLSLLKRSFDKSRWFIGVCHTLKGMKYREWSEISSGSIPALVWSVSDDSLQNTLSLMGSAATSINQCGWCNLLKEVISKHSV